MTNTEMNRKIVQDGLNRRAATAKAKEAALEAVGREFRAGINQHSKNLRDDMKAAEEAQRRKEEQEAAATLRREQRAMQEAKECYTWYAIMAVTTGPLLLAAVAIALCNSGNLSIWVMLPIAVMACMYSAAALIVNLSIRCKFPSIRGAIDRILDAAEKFRTFLTVPLMAELENEE